MGVTRGHNSPDAESLWGRWITARGAKSPNNFTSTFCNTVHLLPKDFRFEHGPPNLLLDPNAILTSLRPCSVAMLSQVYKIQTLLL